MPSPFIYTDYRFNQANSRRITNNELLGMISDLEKNANKKLTTEILGQSVEGRDIVLLHWGIGKHKILMWSQMHGNEPTATLALLDLINLFTKESEHVFIKNIYENISLYMIPMLNPDGAQRFQRRNALGIDLNRDALNLQSPESKILKRAAEKIQPEWGFNLHDQNPRYTVGNSGKGAMISLLAPAFDAERNDNSVRLRAKKMCAVLSHEIETRVGKRVGKYADDFGIRCFGDNFQKWGISTVLIESGGSEHDLNKNKIRELNFYAYLTAFDSIMSNQYEKCTPQQYDNIPLNGALLTDLKLTNLILLGSDDLHNLKIDIAINFVPMMDAVTKEEKLIGVVYDLGDMRTLSAYQTSDQSNWQIQPTHSYILTQNLTSDELKNKMLEGVCTFIVTKGIKIQSDVPANFISADFSVDHNTTTLLPGERASFQVLDSEKKLTELWINGWKVYSRNEGWIKHEPFVMPDKVKGLEVEL